MSRNLNLLCCKTSHNLHGLNSNFSSICICGEAFQLVCFGKGERICSSYAKTKIRNSRVCRSVKSAMFIGARSNAVGNDRMEELLNSISKKPSYGHDFSQMCQILQHSRKCRKESWSTEILISEQTGQTVNSYFCRHPEMCLRRTVVEVGTPYYTIYNIL